MVFYVKLRVEINFHNALRRVFKTNETVLHIDNNGFTTGLKFTEVGAHNYGSALRRIYESKLPNESYIILPVHCMTF